MDARILLVEDDASTREVTAIGLRNAVFRVETAQLIVFKDERTALATREGLIRGPEEPIAQ